MPESAPPAQSQPAGRSAGANGCLKDVCLYWGLALATVLTASAFGAWLAWTLRHTGALPPLVALIALALLIWVCHLTHLPSLGSLFLRRPGLPPPATWLMLAAALLAYFAKKLSAAIGIHAIGGLEAAGPAAVLALMGYSLLLPRLLARQARRRPRLVPSTPETASGAGDGASPSANPRTAGATQPATTLGAAPSADPKDAPWDAPANDTERRDRLLRWLSAPENPIDRAADDLFDTAGKAARLLELLRPASACAPAGTVCLQGPRGSGKSTLLRLAMERERSESPGAARRLATLRFCTISLWDYADTQAAIKGAFGEVLALIRDRTDILPLQGAPTGVARAIFSAARLPAFVGANSAPPLHLWLPALSELLVRAGLRVILCIEDDDRIAAVARQASHGEVLQGLLDQLKLLPGFGYVICVSTPVWSEPSPGDIQSPPPSIGAPAEEKWKNYNERWKAASRGGKISAQTAPALEGEEETIVRLEAAGLAREQRSRWAAEAGFLPMSRLCQYRLLVSPQLEYQAVLRVFRLWMVQQVWPDLCLNGAGQLCGLESRQRRISFEAFIRERSEGGVMGGLTPRTLRNGLREARRRWLNIVATVQGGETLGGGVPQDWRKAWAEGRIGIDFDSVLVACLVSACYPERWQEFLGSMGRSAQSGTFQQNFARQLLRADPAQPPPPAYVAKGEPSAQLVALSWMFGLSPTVWSILATRPGGITGDNAEENWRLFAGS